MTPEELNRLAELSADVLYTDEEFREWRRLLAKAQRHREPEQSDYCQATGQAMPWGVARLRAKEPCECCRPETWQYELTPEEEQAHALWQLDRATWPAGLYADLSTWADEMEAA